MPPALLMDFARPDRTGEALLQDAATKFALSARGYHRTLRLARTLADLDGSEKVMCAHIAEALAYRGESGTKPAATAPRQVSSAGLEAPF